MRNDVTVEELRRLLTFTRLIHDACHCHVRQAHLFNGSLRRTSLRRTRTRSLRRYERDTQQYNDDARKREQIAAAWSRR